MNRIGIAAWAFSDISLPDNLRRIAEMGYTAAHLSNSVVEKVPSQEFAEAGKVIADLDLTITIHGSFGIDTPAMKYPDPHDMFERLKRLLDWQSKTGRIACISYDAQKTFEGDRKVLDFATMRELFARALEMSSGSGVLMLIEDCPLNVDHLSQFGKLSDPSWGILIDLGHMNMRLRKAGDGHLSPEAIREYMAKIPLPVREIHIHSNDGFNDQHLPPYMGNAPIADFARALDAIGFDGIATIEAMPWWCDGDQDQMRSAAKESLKFWTEIAAGRADANPGG